MYQYDNIDQTIVNERVAQFRDQTLRYLSGKLTDDEFRPLRLQNGLYIQRHAPMLRVAIPYGLLSSKQLRKLADISDRFDRGYGHFSTRQNLQLNWPKLEETPDILEELSKVEMHAIQTSGNCIRNITTDQFAGVAPDEIIDPRAIAEILRQWSTFHPEFSLLPRKFKIAVSGSKQDRAIVQAHDIGLEFYYDKEQKMAIRIWVGGGLGQQQLINDNKWIRLERFEPDFVQSGQMSLIVTGKGYADDVDNPSTPYYFTPSTLKVDMKEQRREMRLRIGSNTFGGDYQLGNCIMSVDMGDERGTGSP